MEANTDDDYLLSRGTNSQYNGAKDFENGAASQKTPKDNLNKHNLPALATERSQTSSFANILVGPSIDSDRGHG